MVNLRLFGRDIILIYVDFKLTYFVSCLKYVEDFKNAN